MTNKLEPQPNNSHTDDDVLDLNNAIAGAITGVQQPIDTKLNDQEYEQLYAQLQQRVDAAINTLTDVKYDLARLLANDLSHALANDKAIYSYSATHTGITINNYNTVIDTLSSLKRSFKSK